MPLDGRSESLLVPSVRLAERVSGSTRSRTPGRRPESTPGTRWSGEPRNPRLDVDGTDGDEIGTARLGLSRPEPPITRGPGLATPITPTTQAEPRVVWPAPGGRTRLFGHRASVRARCPRSRVGPRASRARVDRRSIQPRTATPDAVVGFNVAEVTARTVVRLTHSARRWLRPRSPGLPLGSGTTSRQAPVRSSGTSSIASGTGDGALPGTVDGRRGRPRGTPTERSARGLDRPERATRGGGRRVGPTPGTRRRPRTNGRVRRTDARPTRAAPDRLAMTNKFDTWYDLPRFLPGYYVFSFVMETFARSRRVQSE